MFAALVRWIGGVSMATLVILPGLIHRPARDWPARDWLPLFCIDGRFARHARTSTIVVGLSAVWIVHRLAPWDRFIDVRFWWLLTMVVASAVFTVLLFVVEPLFLHRWFHARITRDPKRTFRLRRTVSALPTVAGTLGAHGALHYAHGVPC